MPIRCPICQDIVFLTQADWEDFIGVLPLGEHIRVGLVCPKCHREFLLQVNLTLTV